MSARDCFQMRNTFACPASPRASVLSATVSSAFGSAIRASRRPETMWKNSTRLFEPTDTTRRKRRRTGFMTGPPGTANASSADEPRLPGQAVQTKPANSLHAGAPRPLRSTHRRPIRRGREPPRQTSRQAARPPRPGKQAMRRPPAPARSFRCPAGPAAESPLVFAGKTERPETSAASRSHIPPLPSQYATVPCLRDRECPLQRV